MNKFSLQDVMRKSDSADSLYDKSENSSPVPTPAEGDKIV